MTLLLMLLSHNNRTVQNTKGRIIRLLLFAMKMLSGNLIKLYDDIKIPSLIRDKLEKMYRITTIDDLIERKEISDFANDSSDVLMLVYIVRYFNEIRKYKGKNVQLCPLLIKSTQFFSFMAKLAVPKGDNEDEKHSTDNEHKLQMDDDLRKDLEIDGNDTPWRLNSSQPLKYVELRSCLVKLDYQYLCSRSFTHTNAAVLNGWLISLLLRQVEFLVTKWAWAKRS